MFALDMPNVPPQQNAVMLVQKSQAQQIAATNDRTIGECQLIGNPDPENTAVNVISPIVAARIYFSTFENRRIEGSAKVTILKPPSHGRLEDEGDGDYRYRPTPGYLGNDSATVRVEIGGYKVKVIVAFHVLQGPLVGDTSDLYKDLCPKLVYRIALDASRELKDIDVQAWQRSAELSALLAGASDATAGLTDLAGSSVAQTTGEGSSAQITLDTIAAGHGWYVDPTPLDNSDDYLPTSSPNVWQAKAGGEGAGKMDLLSVLLHEYGHALGLEHSVASGDFMAATLQPGQHEGVRSCITTRQS